MYTLFLVSYTLKFYTMMVVNIERKKLDDVNFWNKIRNLNENNTGEQIEVFQTFYWLNDGKIYLLCF
jgi:hypothetical protein